MKESSLRARYLVKLIASIASGLVGMIVIAIVPRAIGASSYGQFVYLQQFFTNIIGFLDAGSSIGFFTKLSAKPKRKVIITLYSIYSLMIFISIAFFFGISNKLGFSSHILPGINQDYIFLGIFFAFLTWLSQVVTKISDAYALTTSVEFIKLAYKLIFLGGLLYILTHLDLLRYFYYNIFLLSAFILVVVVFLARKIIFDRSMLRLSLLRTKTTIRYFIEFCSPLVAYNVVTLSISLLDLWLLQKYSGSIETGYYGLSYSLAAMCFVFTGAMTPIITREFSKAFDSKDIDHVRNVYSRYVPMLYCISAYFSVFIVFNSHSVLVLFTSEEFYDAFWVLAIMGFYPIHQTYGQLSGAIFYSSGETRRYRNIGVTCSVIGFSISLLLILYLQLGAVGLALKMVLTQFITVNTQLYFNSRLLSVRLSKFLVHQIFIIIAFSLIAYTSSVSISGLSEEVNFIISGVVYTGGVLMTIIIWPSMLSTTRQEQASYFNKVKRILHKVC